jgi:hypothetical protein
LEILVTYDCLSIKIITAIIITLKTTTTTEAVLCCYFSFSSFSSSFGARISLCSPE